ncbi:MAG TPA: MarR family winged helix-turn-helix transcriptional regulator [Gemmatimonadaceae bacterium]|nr:MarR family winged helix-turn-helix transcriptional regulator [Gemmatimonadaceae bacterium]
MAARSAKNPRRLADGARGARAPGQPILGNRDKEKAFRSIRALVAALQTSARAVEERSGLTNAQLFLLRQIAGSDGLTINDLSRRTSAAQSSVSVVVARLVRAGHVKRARVAEDGRRVTLTATARGRTTVRKAPPPATERLLAALGRISAADARSIARGIGALLPRLGAREKEAPLLFEAGGS